MKKKRWLSFIVALAVLITSITLPAPKTEAAGRDTYWIKVNRQANVVTVYKKSGSKYKPIKAMLCSCGGSNTPLGTFRTPAKYRWHTLMGPSYGQYCTRIYGGVLFHSVWYYQNGNKATQSTVQFNKLGQTASHGCVRLSVADAKWIYDNCPTGTKVTVYASSNPGPLGKPKGIKVSTRSRMGWDPTDPDSRNPYMKNKKPSISISKKKARTVQYGAKYSIKSGVSAKEKSGKSLTKKITYSVARYSKGKYRAAKFSTKKLGTYRIRYKVKNSVGMSVTKDLKIKVVDTKAPVIKGYKSRSVYKGDSTNLLSGISMKMRSGTNRISAAKVTIRNSKNKVIKTLSYKSAKKFKFTAAGKYKVTYTVKNKNKPYRSASKSVYFTVKTKAKPAISGTKNFTIDVADKLALANKTALSGVKAVDYRKRSLTSKIRIDWSKVKFGKPGVYPFTYYVSDSTGKTTVTKYITIESRKIEFSSGLGSLTNPVELRLNADTTLDSVNENWIVNQVRSNNNNVAKIKINEVVTTNKVVKTPIAITNTGKVKQITARSIANSNPDEKHFEVVLKVNTSKNKTFEQKLTIKVIAAPTPAPSPTPAASEN